MDCSPSGSIVHEILQARILEWVFPSPGIFPTQGWNLGLLHCQQILHHLSHQESPIKMDPNPTWVGFVSYKGQQWPATGAEALGAADLGMA